MAIQLDAATLQAALAGYQQQLDTIVQKMAELRQKLGKSGNSIVKVSNGARTGHRKHRMSPEGRARIAEAQRARWAKTRRAAKKTE